MMSLHDDWLMTDNAIGMLRLIKGTAEDSSVETTKISNRRLFLMYAAICSRAWSLLNTESRRYVLRLTLDADKAWQRDDDKLYELGDCFTGMISKRASEAVNHGIKRLINHGILPDENDIFLLGQLSMAMNMSDASFLDNKQPVTLDWAANAIRDIVGDDVYNPLRARYAAGPRQYEIRDDWPLFNQEIRSMAVQAYVNIEINNHGICLDNDRLNVLCDAMQDAGCQDEVWCSMCRNGNGDSLPNLYGTCSRCDGRGVVKNPVLAQLRSRQPQYRGCWALDTVLMRS